MADCDHVWREVREQAIIGGTFRVGWECELCHGYVAIGDLMPGGIGGVVGPRVRLVGVHGGYIETASGKECREQIYDRETQRLTYA